MLLLAKNYKDDFDPTGWHLSEKIDGIRAFWNGKQLISRNNIPFNAPDWFIECLPSNVQLDGELWISRKGFNEVSSVVRTEKGSDWSRVQYLLFDIPRTDFGPVENRWSILQKLVIKINRDHIKMIPNTICQGHDHLHKLLSLVIEHEGEGIMMRKPGSMYVNKRSDTLLKVKKFYDEEAIVTGHNVMMSNGREVTGMMGSLKCVNESGDEFKVGTGFTDHERKNPPKIGSKITYKYFEKSKDGAPRFPVFVCVRDYE